MHVEQARTGREWSEPIDPPTEVLQDQLETLRVKDLLNRVLETLIRTFNATGGLIVLTPERGSDELRVQAWKGMNARLARCFDAKFGEGLTPCSLETLTGNCSVGSLGN